MREELGKYRHTKACPACGGSRLRREARHVLIGNEPGTAQRRGRAIFEVEALPLAACLALVPGPGIERRQEAKSPIASCAKSNPACTFLNNVGLNYLSLDRSADTISGGEAQRIRLASQIGSGLTGVMYVLDEPSIGLHQRDNDRLIVTLQHLRDLGNSVIVVEHDEDMIRVGRLGAWIWAPAPASTADTLSPQGTPAGTGGQRRIADRPIPERRRSPSPFPQRRPVARTTSTGWNS